MDTIFIDPRTEGSGILTIRGGAAVRKASYALAPWLLHGTASRITNPSCLPLGISNFVFALLVHAPFTLCSRHFTLFIWGEGGTAVSSSQPSTLNLRHSEPPRPLRPNLQGSIRVFSQGKHTPPTGKNTRNTPQNHGNTRKFF